MLLKTVRTIAGVGAGVALLAGTAVTSLAQDEGADEKAPPTGWTPELALDVKDVSNVLVSPDGRRVVFQVSEAIMEEETSEWRSHLWIANADGSGQFQLTRGDKSCSGAAWSPDGEWIAFTTSRGGEKSNIWRIRVAGGEAEQLTDLESGASSIQWSPDGSRIAFTMMDAETEDEKADKKQKNDPKLVDKNLKMNRLYVLDVDDEDAEPRLLTDGEMSVGGRFGGGGFDWSPDGTTIAFGHSPTAKVDDWVKSDVSLVDVETGSVRTLAATNASEGNPRYSPDGSWIALGVSDDPPTWAFRATVHVVPSQGGTPRALAVTPDERPGIVGWSASGDRLFISETHRTEGRIYALGTDGSIETVSPEGMHVGGVSMNDVSTHFGFTVQRADVPEEAYASAVDGFRARRISSVQDLPDVPIGRTETFTWESTDGLEVEGMLTLPPDYVQGERIPMVVVVHGGPAGVFTQRFIGTRGAYPIASFAEKGMAVLRVNPRGSSGYGADFRYANYHDWGGMDYQDIMTGIDEVIDRGIADPDSLGIMGWSYGGYMTSWVVTQTDRFKAASIGAAVTNLLSFTGTADIPSFIPDYFEGESWENMEGYLKHSAMAHVQNATTPSLIQHGENDLRVPVSQGYEFYNALQRRGVPVEMVVYPRQPHGIREPKLQLHAMEHNLEWFEARLMKD